MTLTRRTALSLLAASLSARTAKAAAPQGFAGLGQAAEGFALPSRQTRLRFPEDHGPHPAFRIEWWYVTANLRDARGTDYGIQWTLFRSALAPHDAEGWNSPQIWFAHAAMTRAETHLVAERRARGGIGQAGATATPFNAWIDDWQMQGRAEPGHDPLSALHLRASGAGWHYALRLETPAPLALQGDNGFSLKHERGQASHYYSQPHYRVEGQLHWPDAPVAVTGQAWLDREWSSQPLDPDQSGWDWFALHLDSGHKLMVYQLRDSDGGHVPGSWITPDGQVTPLSHGQITLAPLAQSEVAGRRIPTRWSVRVPAYDTALEVSALNPQSWMSTGISYWEGPVRVKGSHTGHGYLEMTGYA